MRLFFYCNTANYIGRVMEMQWVGRLRMMATECKYKELNRHLKEQFINGLNDDGRVGIIKGAYLSGEHQLSKSA